MENIKMPLRVLILENRPEDAELMLYELRKSGFQPEAHRVDTEADFQNQLSVAPALRGAPCGNIRRRVWP